MSGYEVQDGATVLAEVDTFSEAVEWIRNQASGREDDDPHARNLRIVAVLCSGEDVL